MEKLKFNYSTKNIPIPSEKAYKLKLLEKIEALIVRMRWRAMYETDNSVSKQTYGLKSFKTPPPVSELLPFENDLFELVKKVKFRKVKNVFQQKLNEDIRNIRNSDKTITPADKTANMYRLTKDEYNKMLHNSITSAYKKTNNNIKKRININGKKIIETTRNETLSKMKTNGEENAFFTLKDHKANFINNPTVRLINPAKNEVGRISKVILDKINNKLRDTLQVNQWKSTASVINWFRNIKEKNLHKFIIFDIKDFYPSISQELLQKSLNFAQRFIDINTNDKEIIFHSRKSLLFTNTDTWMKKNNTLFDVTMGAYDGAEVCELIGIYLLHQLSIEYEIGNFGLYRDDGLGVLKSKSGTESEKIKKNIQKMFKENGLDLVIQCNLTIVNYLDVTLNLNNATYRPYHKLDKEIFYIHKHSNHPPNTIRRIPASVETRISNLSSTQKIFYESATHYEEVLKKSGYQHKFTYQIQNNINNNRNKRNRKRKIIWFNPPFSLNVTSKIGKYFLNLITKHFPTHHKFHKIFNRNTLKISYSCMPNIRSKINGHNLNIIQNQNINSNIDKCNCHNKNQCPLNNNCLAENIIYQANITCNLPNHNEKVYIGLCETSFKKRFANHKKSFSHRKYSNETELAKEYWSIKEQNGVPIISWKILRKCRVTSNKRHKCYLCLTEKFEILTYSGNNLLNKRSELITACRHSNRFKLMNSDSKD